MAATFSNNRISFFPSTLPNTVSADYVHEQILGPVVKRKEQVEKAAHIRNDAANHNALKVLENCVTAINAVMTKPAIEATQSNQVEEERISSSKNYNPF